MTPHMTRVVLELSGEEAAKLKAALSGPSVDDPDLARIYERLVA